MDTAPKMRRFCVDCKVRYMSVISVRAGDKGVNSYSEPGDGEMFWSSNVRLFTVLFSSASVVRSSITRKISSMRSLVSAIVAALVWSRRVASFRLLSDKNMSNSSSTSEEEEKSAIGLPNFRCNLYEGTVPSLHGGVRELLERYEIGVIVRILFHMFRLSSIELLFRRIHACRLLLTTLVLVKAFACIERVVVVVIHIHTMVTDASDDIEYLIASMVIVGTLR